MKMVGEIARKRKQGLFERPSLMTGWWYTYPSKTYEFVSSDDIMFQTTNQYETPIIETKKKASQFAPWLS